MVATRCIKCMTLLEDGGQYCADCRPGIARPSSSAPTLEQPPNIDGSPVVESTCESCGQPLATGQVCECQRVIPRSDVKFAGFFVRAAAYMADWLILGVVGIVVAFATNSLIGALLAMIGVGLICFAGFWIADGATPGKMLFNLKVRMTDGSSLEPVSAVLRYAGYWVSGAMLGIGFLVMLFDEEKRCLHDRIANTIVVVERNG